jgi:hypothetical protein
MPPLISISRACSIREQHAVDRGGDQAFRSADFRSRLRWDIAAITPIRSIKMYIFNVSSENSSVRIRPHVVSRRTSTLVQYARWVDER